MVELVAQGALHGLGLPLAAGDAVLSAAVAEPALGLVPYRGQEAAVAQALARHEGALPEAGQAASIPGGRVIWAGMGRWLLCGPAAEDAVLCAALEPAAALTDQSDAWAALRLQGKNAASVLARLVPLDLDPSAFPPDAAARTLLGHISCVLVAEADGFKILVTRSFAASAVHTLDRAMRSVAGIAALKLPPT